jgi:predicted  nucleic acid-binding Zn-ribbon protein
VNNKRRAVMTGKYIFIGGLLHEEYRENIKGNIYTVPYDPGNGATYVQTYNKTNIDERITVLKKEVNKLNRAIEQRVKPLESDITQRIIYQEDMASLEQKLAKKEAELKYWKEVKRRHKLEFAFVFYRDNSPNKEHELPGKRNPELTKSQK